MKTKILKLLRISRPTLTRLIKRGEIKVKRLPNGRLDYDPESVYRYLLEKFGKEPKRKTVIYARVSTSKQKQDLLNQIETANNYFIAQLFYEVLL